MLKVGFARVDVTPPLGVDMPGYYQQRNAKEILDPLEITAVAFSDGDASAVIYQIDTEAVHDKVVARMKEAVGTATGLKPENLYVHASHTHTGGELHPFGVGSPGENPIMDSPARKLDDLYIEHCITRMADVSRLALADLKPAKLSCARTVAKRISFGRRYLMKDGRTLTNPGVGNPDIVRAAGNPPDEEVLLLRADREGGKPVAVISFQTHPDVVGGESISADWPGMTRRVFERATGGDAHCIFLNGTQGDVNHVCVNPGPGELNGMHSDFDDVYRGYDHALHMANVVAGAALAQWLKCAPLADGKVRCAVKAVRVPSQRPTAEELVVAKKYWALHEAGKDEEIPFKGMELTTEVARAGRMLALENGPDYFDLNLSAIAVGDVAFAGFPGEPFNDIGKAVKKDSPFAFTVPTCLTNGSQGYFPFSDAYKEGGYESATSPFGPTVADDLIKGQLELLGSMK